MSWKHHSVCNAENWKRRKLEIGKTCILMDWLSGKGESFCSINAELGLLTSVQVLAVFLGSWQLWILRKCSLIPLPWSEILGKGPGHTLKQRFRISSCDYRYIDACFMSGETEAQANKVTCLGIPSGWAEGLGEKMTGYQLLIKSQFHIKHFHWIQVSVKTSSCEVLIVFLYHRQKTWMQAWGIPVGKNK